MSFKVIRAIIFVFMSLNFSTPAMECKKNEVLEDYGKALETIQTQSKEINSILSGSEKSKLSSTLIFGHDFTLEKTKKVIEELQEKRDKDNGIADEHKIIWSCLQKLNLTKQSDQFHNSSKKLINLKIELISKNEELNNFIKSNLDSSQALPDMKLRIESEKKEAEEVKKDITKSTTESDEQVLSEINSTKKELLILKNNLKKNKLEIINVGLRYSEKLEQSIEVFEKKSKLLKEISLSVSKNPQEDNLSKNFFIVQSIWKEVIGLNFKHLIKSSPLINFPDELKVPKNNVEEKLRPIVKEIESLSNENIEKKREIIKDISSKKKYEIRLQTTLLSQANALRSRIFLMMPNSFLFEQFRKKSFYISLAEEISSSPQKVITFLYTKFIYIRENYISDKDGLKKISIDVFKVIVFVFILFLLHYFIEHSYNFIDRLFSTLVAKYHRNKIIKSAISVWNKYKENFHSIVWLIICKFTMDSELPQDVLILSKFATIYFTYKIIKSLVVITLGKLSRLDLSNFYQFKKRANQTSEYLANVYLSYTIIMIFIEGTAGKVFIYTIINFCVLILSFHRIGKAAFNWKDELLSYLERNFSGMIVDKIQNTSKLLPNKYVPFLHLISIALLSIFDLLIQLTENLEISKKISANIFKKQLANIDAPNGSKMSIPEEYQENFSGEIDLSAGQFIVSDEKIYKNMKLDIDEWLREESEEHSLVVYGDKGIGKTTLIKQVLTTYEKNENSKVETIFKKVPSKVITEDDLHKFMKDLFEMDSSESLKSTIYDYDQSLENKVIIYLDEAQNVFLSKERGFEAYYALINIINFNTNNIFWVLSFNKYSWLYLDRAFGKNQFFRNVYELRGWSDVKIKDLILKRHACAEFKLSYDTLINATRSQDEIDRYATVESKFFKLLWEMSSGNPRMALFLWLSALSRKNVKTLSVNLPKYKDINNLSELSDDFLFTMAHIIKHENLSSKEIETTTNLSEGVVRNAIKMALELKLLYRDERRRYMVDIYTQNQMIKYLRSKNYLYGN